MTRVSRRVAGDTRYNSPPAYRPQARPLSSRISRDMAVRSCTRATMHQGIEATLHEEQWASLLIDSSRTRNAHDSCEIARFL